MPIKFDWSAQVADYRGLLTFPQVTDAGTATPITYPSITIPLYIKEHPIPVRAPKITEVNTLPVALPNATWQTGYSAMFFGAPSPLSLQLSGWVITPTTPINRISTWDPTTDGRFKKEGGTSLGLLNWSYGDLITAYLDGRMNRTDQIWKRVDPISYTDPYGRVYTSPIVTSFEYNYVQPQKKQTFSLELWLEGDTTPND